MQCFHFVRYFNEFVFIVLTRSDPACYQREAALKNGDIDAG